MRVLILTQLFQPEPNHLKGLSFAKALIRHGHTVDVLTCYPNYPGGKLYTGYSMGLKLRENIEGVHINRIAHYLDHTTSGFKRIASYISFAAMASIIGPLLVQRPDVIHVYQGPATLCITAMLFKYIYRVPYVLDIQDIWPDSVTASGMLMFQRGLSILDTWCNSTYRMARKIVVLSEGYARTLVKRGVPSEKIEVVHNWCNEDEMLPGNGYTREIPGPEGTGKFNIMFAGNMGKVQALETVLFAAHELRDELPDAQFCLIGDGVELCHLKQLATRLALNNVNFISRQPVHIIGQILSRADALLIHLKDDPLSRIGIPQKTQAYMAVGKPVIMAVKGNSAELIERSGGGIVCEPESPTAIADAVRMLVRMTPEERKAIGDSGRSFYARELSFSVGASRMISILEDVATCK